MHVSSPAIFSEIQNGSLSNTPPSKINAAAREMEGLFVSLLLKEMRQSSSEGGLFPGDSSDTFGGMFDLYLGKYIAESGGIGLADSIEKTMK